MTPLVWLGILLAALFFLAMTGIPLWMTFKRPETEPDFSQARAYLAAKEDMAMSEAPARRQESLTGHAA